MFRGRRKRYALVFISCEGAAEYFYKDLPEDVVSQCKKNVDEFYQDPELQKKWEMLILHPICFKVVEGVRNPILISLKDLGPDDSILKKKEIRPCADFSEVKNILYN